MGRPPPSSPAWRHKYRTLSVSQLIPRASFCRLGNLASPSADLPSRMLRGSDNPAATPAGRRRWGRARRPPALPATREVAVGQGASSPPLGPLCPAVSRRQGCHAGGPALASLVTVSPTGLGGRERPGGGHILCWHQSSPGRHRDLPLSPVGSHEPSFKGVLVGQRGPLQPVGTPSVSQMTKCNTSARVGLCPRGLHLLLPLPRPSLQGTAAHPLLRPAEPPAVGMAWPGGDPAS